MVSRSPEIDSNQSSLHSSPDSISPRDITRANMSTRVPRKRKQSRRKGEDMSFPPSCAEREAWRSQPRASRQLGNDAVAHLQSALDGPYAVYPRTTSFSKNDAYHGVPSASELPVLSITPLELFRHILACFAGSSWSCEGREEAEAEEPFVEIFGGVAHAICQTDMVARQQSENTVQLSSFKANSSVAMTASGKLGADCAAHRRPEPTDLDARFYIPQTESFDSCRAIVEEYLHLKLCQALSPDSVLRSTIASPSQVRYLYFQKQAVVGGAFSLLSVGDPATGRNIDMEFAYMGNGTRKYFDDANSSVIPLSLTQLAGAQAVCALSQCGDFELMCDLIRSQELLVPRPEEVLNGLSLYAHALCEKSQRPVDADAEDAYGQCLCDAFVQQCQQLLEQNQEPTRFIRSFIRSHYAGRPIKAVVTLVQMLVELSAYAPEVKDWDMAVLLCDRLCALLAETVAAALQASEASSTDLHLTLLSLMSFLARPGPGHELEDDVGDFSETSSETSCGASSSSSAATLPTHRLRSVRTGAGSSSSLLAKAFAVDTSAVCSIVGAQLIALARRPATPEWARAVLDTAAEALRQERSEGELVGRLLGRWREAGEYGAAFSTLKECGGRRAEQGCVRVPREVVVAEAKAMLRECPVEMAEGLSMLITRACGRRERHRETREAIKVVQARWRGGKGAESEVDRAMLALLMGIPKARKKDQAAHKQPPRQLREAVCNGVQYE